jgi:hypothetical protein
MTRHTVSVDSFSLSIIALSALLQARSSLRTPRSRRADVALEQQAHAAFPQLRPSRYQCFRRFGTMSRNFSTELRRFRWQAQMAVSLPILSVRGETR